MISLLVMIAVVLVPSLESELKILDTHDGGTGPAPCSLTCVGSGRRHSGWVDSGSNPGYVFMMIEIEECNFVSAPVITTTTVTAGSQLVVCPAVSVWHLSRTVFYVYSVEHTSAHRMELDECIVHWSAFGYNC